MAKVVLENLRSEGKTDVETLGMPELTLDADTRSRYLGITHQETHKLEAIIGDLLDLARLEGGGDTIEPEELVRWVCRHEYYHLGQIIIYRWMQGDNPYARGAETGA